MPTGKITKRTVDALKPNSDGALVLWDEELPGFGCQVLPSGKKAYLVQYYLGTKKSRYHLGLHGVLTPEQARNEARQVKLDVRAGIDPVARRKAGRRGLTVSKVLDRYLEEHAQRHKRETSLRNDTLLIDNHVRPALGKLPVREVNRQHVSKLHASLEATPYAANRTLALLSKLFNLCELWGLRPDGTNPCRHVKRYPEEKRRRYLSGEELARLGGVLRDEEQAGADPFVIAAVRLLLFTGARLSEILTLRWEHVDSDRQCLALPTSKTGQKDVVLNPGARQVLDKLPRVDRNPYVIVGRVEGEHLVNLEKPWRRIRELAKIPDVRIHDLRHSHASIAAGLGASLPIIGALLGHTQAQTTARYAHLAADPVRAVSNSVSSRLTSLLNSKEKPGKVSKLRANQGRRR